METQNNNSKFIILCGFPAAGKSTLLSHVRETHKNIVVLSPDEFRWAITGQQYHQPAEDMVWGTVKTCARVLVKNYCVVIDGTHVSIESRKQWTFIAKNMAVPIECWWLNTSYDECVRRNSKRLLSVPLSAMERMRDNFREPAYVEGFDKILTVQFDNHNVNFTEIPKPENIAPYKIPEEQELG